MVVKIGVPGAELRPVGIGSLRERRQEAADQVMREVEDLARRISHAWKTAKTGVEVVEEQRRAYATPTTAGVAPSGGSGGSPA